MINEDLMECHYSFERLAREGNIGQIPDETLRVFLGRLSHARKSPLRNLESQDQAWLDAALSFWRDFFNGSKRRTA